MEKEHDAAAMAKSVEKWLGNPLARSILKLVSSRCTRDGRRMENSLALYAGLQSSLSKNLCASCRISARLTGNVIDSVLYYIDAEKSGFKERLKDSVWRKGFASVLEGIAEYGTVKPFTSYTPFLVVWNFTKECNLRCKHCYESADKKAPDELSTEDALRAVDLMADAGVAYIALSGGEPLVRHDLFEIIERIRQNEVGFSIATNGTLLTSEIARKLKKSGCLSVQVSLDGATPESHNWLRGMNSFERAIKGIKNARQKNLDVNIATTVTQRNLAEVPAIIDIAEKSGAGFMHYNFIPTGKGKNIAGMDLSAAQRENFLKYLAGETKKRKILLLSTAPQYGRICTENEAAVLAMSHFDPSSASGASGSLRFLAEFIGGCGTGRLYCALEPNGDITPCVFMPIKLGNIKKDDFLRVWHNSPVLKDIRDRKNFSGNCPICKYRNVCGGCRARAYAYFGNVKGPDPGCVHNAKYGHMNI